MADEMNNIPEEELYDEIYTLTDEEGNESEFKLIGTCEIEGTVYRALIPLTDDGEEDGDQYVVLRQEKDENGDDTLVTIEDDEEFDRVADLFDDEFSEVDYDEADGDA